MAEYIDRLEAYLAIGMQTREGHNKVNKGLAAALDAIGRLSAADVMPVVRCRNCQNAEPWYADHLRCFLWHKDGIGVWEDGFCNYGVNREENNGN